MANADAGQTQSTPKNTKKPALDYDNHEHTAKRLLKHTYSHGGHPTLRVYEGKSYAWSDGAYRQLLKCELRATIRNSLAAGEVVVSVPERDDHGKELKDGQGNKIYKNVRVAYLPSITRVNEVLDALSSLVTIDSRRSGNFWISDSDIYDNGDILPVQNGLLHLDSRELIPHTPDYFCRAVSRYSYDPSAKLDFGAEHMRQVYEGHEDCIETLFNWWGMVLAPELDIHKMMFRVGPQRSGKGTEAYIVSGIIGDDAMVSPTLEAFDPSSRTFGIEAMIGKRLSMVNEATVSNKMDKHALASTLKSMSARDPQLVDRKGISSVTVRSKDVPRIQLCANDLASMRDSSGALGDRFVMIQTRVSFKDREDVERKAKIDAEGSAWLNAALDGRVRVKRELTLRTPQSCQALHAAFNERASPISSFLQECCELDPKHTEVKDVVYESFRVYIRDVFGHDYKESKHKTEAAIMSAAPSVEPGRLSASANEKRPYVFKGIRVKPEWVPDRVKRQQAEGKIHVIK